MKMEAWIFGMSTAFFVIVSPAYWLMSKDWTGTSALVMTTLLVAMITLYLGFHASKMEPRPEDRKDADIADGAGELGFFPPYSWWPLWCGATLAVIVYGVALGQWWLVAIGMGLGHPGAERARLRVLQGRTRATDAASSRSRRARSSAAVRHARGESVVALRPGYAGTATNPLSRESHQHDPAPFPPARSRVRLRRRGDARRVQREPVPGRRPGARIGHLGRRDPG